MLEPSGFFAFISSSKGSQPKPFWQKMLPKYARGDCFSPIIFGRWGQKCHPSWVYSEYTSWLHVTNWFLAVDRAHHPLMVNSSF